MKQDKGRPIPGVQYSLTGGKGQPSIMGGNTWAESRVTPKCDGKHDSVQAIVTCPDCKNDLDNM